MEPRPQERVHVGARRQELGMVAAVIPGGRSTEQIRANAASMTAIIPVAFWDALEREALIAADAPVPM